ncbi:MAG TPA: hypothetical protein VMN79_04985 [Casimicrobiaceae bacterium]|nr:hypothetical protein [Casimicrobiaceae bacterium]
MAHSGGRPALAQLDRRGGAAIVASRGLASYFPYGAGNCVAGCP